MSSFHLVNQAKVDIHNSFGILLFQGFLCIEGMSSSIASIFMFLFYVYFHFNFIGLVEQVYCIFFFLLYFVDFCFELGLSVSFDKGGQKNCTRKNKLEIQTFGFVKLYQRDTWLMNLISWFMINEILGIRHMYNLHSSQM